MKILTLQIIGLSLLLFVLGVFGLVHERFIRGADKLQRAIPLHRVHSSTPRVVQKKRVPIRSKSSATSLPAPSGTFKAKHPPVIRWASSVFAKYILNKTGFKFCTLINEPQDNDTWHDNWLCSFHNHGFRWSHTGSIKGMRCTKINEPAEPSWHGWKNNYLCLPKKSKLQIRWANTNLSKQSLKKQGFKRCEQLWEVSDPHSWNDNYLCYR